MTSKPRKLFARESGPGVPEAIIQVLSRMSKQLKPDNMETIWIFPPMINKRKEWGLIAASCYADGTSRSLYTGRYFAQRESGKLSLDVEISEEGKAPVDSLTRVMVGVVRRSQIDLGSPRAYMIEGEREVFDTLLADLEAELMEVGKT